MFYLMYFFNIYLTEILLTNIHLSYFRQCSPNNAVVDRKKQASAARFIAVFHAIQDRQYTVLIRKYLLRSLSAKKPIDWNQSLNIQNELVPHNLFVTTHSVHFLQKMILYKNHKVHCVIKY